jgi:hypothetical protein
MHSQLEDVTQKYSIVKLNPQKKYFNTGIPSLLIAMRCLTENEIEWERLSIPNFPADIETKREAKRIVVVDFHMLTTC